MEKDPAKAKQCMLDDGVPLSSIPDYLGGDSAGVDAADLLLRGMVDVDADDPRQAWPKRERRELAPSIVKRRGFHGSVSGRMVFARCGVHRASGIPRPMRCCKFVRRI